MGSGISSGPVAPTPGPISSAGASISSGLTASGSAASSGASAGASAAGASLAGGASAAAAGGASDVGAGLLRPFNGSGTRSAGSTSMVGSGRGAFDFDDPDLVVVDT